MVASSTPLEALKSMGTEMIFGMQESIHEASSKSSISFSFPRSSAFTCAFASGSSISSRSERDASASTWLYGLRPLDTHTPTMGT